MRPSRLVAAFRVTSGRCRAIRVSGGSSYFNRSELSRLYRDVLAGIFHPSDDESVHGAWANALLGKPVEWPPAD